MAAPVLAPPPRLVLLRPVRKGSDASWRRGGASRPTGLASASRSYYLAALFRVATPSGAPAARRRSPFRYRAAVTINGWEPAAASLDPVTRAVLVKLIGRAIDELGIEEARSFAPKLVDYLAGAPPGRVPAVSPYRRTCLSWGTAPGPAPAKGGQHR